MDTPEVVAVVLRPPGREGYPERVVGKVKLGRGVGAGRLTGKWGRPVGKPGSGPVGFRGGNDIGGRPDRDMGVVSPGRFDKFGMPTG